MIRIIITTILLLFGQAALLAQKLDANQLVRESQAILDKAESFEIAQKTEQVTVPVIEGNAPAPIMKAVTDSTFLVRNVEPKYVRMSRPLPGGKELLAYRYKGNFAVKNGDGPWKKPEGIFTKLKGQLVNDLGESPLPGRFGGPKWQQVEDPIADKAGLIVLEIVGDSALGFAQDRISKGLKVSAADPDNSARVTVKQFSVKQWISASSKRRLRSVETARFTVFYSNPRKKSKRQIEVQATNTALYRNYNGVTVTIPPEAMRVLSGK